MPSSQDWTDRWTEARALALVARARDPRLLASPASRRLLELALAVEAVRWQLPVAAHVVLPGSLRLIGLVPSPLPWPLVLGRVKAAHGRWLRDAGAVMPRCGWARDVDVRPLRPREISPAVEALHLLPVREGLVREPLDWDATSARPGWRWAG